MGTVSRARAIDDALRCDVRPMTVDDVDGVVAVIEATKVAQVDAGLRPARPAPSAAQLATTRLSHARMVQRDGPGAWVAVDERQVVGVVESIRRSSFWGLSIFFVHPDYQSSGIGARLFQASRSYGDGATQHMVVSSPDPRAMRRYFLAGLAMHPAAELEGRPDRRAIPPSLPGRDGNEMDLDLVASVEAQLGRSRTEDVAFALSDEHARLHVVDSGQGRGWALSRRGWVAMLGATDEQTAATLLWRHLADFDGDTGAYGLTAAQQWALAVAYEARLSVRVTGALFVAGMDVPGPWIPSGWYF